MSRKQILIVVSLIITAFIIFNAVADQVLEIKQQKATEEWIKQEKEIAIRKAEEQAYKEQQLAKWKEDTREFTFVKYAGTNYDIDGICRKIGDHLTGALVDNPADSKRYRMCVNKEMIVGKHYTITAYNHNGSYVEVSREN